MHVCPMVTGVVPHVGGPISGPGCPTVLIAGLPAARVTDMAVCVGPPDTIVKGSAGVFIGGMPAARMGDSCAQGGTIVVGSPTVLIGDSAGGGGGGGAAGAGASGTAGTGAVAGGTAAQGGPASAGEPAPRSLTDIQARDWYNAKVAEIDKVEQQMRADEKSSKEIFETTTQLRNEAKMRARELMKDQDLAKSLPPPKTSEEVLAKYGGDYEKAIAGSKRTNPGVNKLTEDRRSRGEH
jgi:uncharacterized Zn-binding protein involved in type VI secretion